MRPKEFCFGMIPPNFFIIGAPRAATTFLYRALSAHPAIFMSAVKEPGFFSNDERDPDWVTPVASPKRLQHWNAYLDLFRDSDPYPVRGEASTGYLADAHAAVRIKKRLGTNPRFAVILRNPVDRAYSHYVYHRMLNVEPAPTFEAFLEDEPRRIRDNWNMQWRYRETGLYSRHLTTYVSLFGAGQLLVLLHEDFQDADQVFGQVARFLGVPETWAVPLDGPVNESGVSKGALASWILKSRNPIKLLARRILPRSARTSLRGHLTDAPPPLAADTRKRLADSYRDDIDATEALLGRSLEAWRT